MHLGVSWAMLAAAAVGFGVGAVWYGIFGEPWLRAIGKARGEIKPSPVPWLVAVIANLLIAYVLASVMQGAGISGWSGGLITGFFMWMGFTISILALNNVFAGRPNSLTVIDGGHALLNICLQGVVLGMLSPSYW